MILVAHPPASASRLTSNKLARLKNIQGPLLLPFRDAPLFLSSSNSVRASCSQFATSFCRPTNRGHQYFPHLLAFHQFNGGLRRAARTGPLLPQLLRRFARSLQHRRRSDASSARQNPRLVL